MSAAKSAATPPPCPKCGSDDVARIVYGLPNFSDEDLMREVQDGEVVLGGCVIVPGSPKWHCNACSHQWGGFDLDDDEDE